MVVTLLEEMLSIDLCLEDQLARYIDPMDNHAVKHTSTLFVFVSLLCRIFLLTDIWASLKTKVDRSVIKIIDLLLLCIRIIRHNAAILFVSPSLYLAWKPKKNIHSRISLSSWNHLCLQLIVENEDQTPTVNHLCSSLRFSFASLCSVHSCMKSMFFSFLCFQIHRCLKDSFWNAGLPFDFRSVQRRMLINDENLDQLIETIRTVHRTPADQRSIDLTEYLTEFFQAIPASRFESVTRLLRDYDDRAALKIEFVQAQCFEAIHRALNEDEETIVVCLDLIIELLNQSENVQERFVQFDGYEKCFAFLQYLPSPSIQLIDRCLQLIVDTTPSPLLINPSLTVSLIRWIPSLASPADQQHLLAAIDRIVLASLQNKMIACSNGISLALIDTLHRDLTNGTVRGRVLCLLENLIRFSINVEEVRRLFQVFQKNPSGRHYLLHVLLIAAKYSDPDRQSISAYFDLQRPNSVRRRWTLSRERECFAFFLSRESFFRRSLDGHR